MEKQPTRRNNALIIVVIISMLINVFLAIKIFTVKKDKDQALEEKVLYEVEKNNLRHELDSLRAEHDKMKSEYGELSAELLEKDSLIQANIKEIEKLMASGVELNRIKKKMDQLRGITQRYVQQIDSLLVINEELNIDLKEEQKRSITLTKEKQDLTKVKEELSEKVASASEMKAFKVNATGVKVIKRGKEERIEPKAKKADQIKVSFTIVENKLISTGKRDVFVRIAAPDGRILSDGNNGDDQTFTYNGQKIQYTLKQQMDYQGKNVDMKMYWEQTDEFVPGGYSIDVFSEGKVIGTGKFNLE
jgi:hypothetical protein